MQEVLSNFIKCWQFHLEFSMLYLLRAEECFKKFNAVFDIFNFLNNLLFKLRRRFSARVNQHDPDLYFLKCRHIVR